MEEKKTGLLIPKEKLAPETLDALIDEFILREGTDYGLHEYSLEQKRKHVLSQLSARHIFIFFDAQLETTNLLPKEEIKRLRRQNFEIVGLPEGL